MNKTTKIIGIVITITIPFVSYELFLANRNSESASSNPQHSPIESPNIKVADVNIQRPQNATSTDCKNKEDCDLKEPENQQSYFTPRSNIVESILTSYETTSSGIASQYLDGFNDKLNLDDISKVEFLGFATNKYEKDVQIRDKLNQILASATDLELLSLDDSLLTHEQINKKESFLDEIAMVEQQFEQNRVVFEDNVTNLLTSTELAQYKELDRDLSLSQRHKYMNGIVESINQRVTNLETFQITDIQFVVNQFQSYRSEDIPLGASLQAVPGISNNSIVKDIEAAFGTSLLEILTPEQLQELASESL